MKHVIGIACTDVNGVIANEEGLPWRSKDELRYLMNQIEDQRVLMSRGVFKELSRKAPYRKATVITRTPEQYPSTGRIEYRSDLVRAVLEMDLPENRPLYVLGGPSIWVKLAEQITEWDIGIWREAYEGSIYHPFMEKPYGRESMHDSINGFLRMNPRWDYESLQYQTLDIGLINRIRLRRTS